LSDLGNARGRILIDTSDLPRAQREVQQASRAMSQAMGALGALGVGVGVAQFARFAVEADRLATSYARQSVAARNLAGSQSELNELLRVYDDATGGALDKASALQNVTKLMAVGFADSTQELDQFATAIRGISLAMGQSQDFVTQNLVLELFSQRGARLDQLGLQYDLVRQRAEQLQAADSDLTKEMAYQQAVLEQALERFGGLADSTEGAATGLENLGKAWTNFKLAFGEESGGISNIIFEQWASDIEKATNELRQFSQFLRDVELAGQRFRFRIGISDINPDLNSGISDRARGNTSRLAATGSAAEDLTERNAAIVEWHRETLDIERQAARDRLDATRQFESQRTDAIRQYEQTIAREAQDFARQRARSEEDYALSLERLHRDIGQREQRQAEELARNIGQARADSAERIADMEAELARTLAERRADSAERIAEWEADRNEQIGERRRESSERLIELEEEFNRERERAERDSRERLHQAAGQFDAIAINREQRRAAREAEERELAQREQLTEEQKRLSEGVEQLDRAHRKRLEDEAKSLDKAINQAQAAHNRQVANEKEALDKRISQANEAYQLQLEDARAADAQRLEDMAADHELRRRREDEDRGIRLRRMGEDHEAQLGEMARQQEERLIQIAEQEQEARDLLNDEFQKELDDLGIRTDAYAEKVKGFEEAAIEAFDRVWEHWIGVMEGVTVPYAPGQEPTPIYPTPSTGPVGSSQSTMNYQTTMGNVSFTIVQQPGQNSQDLVAAIDQYMRSLGSPYPQ
jgi:hypothetical protein